MSFDEVDTIRSKMDEGLNPFRAGRCLSTISAIGTIPTGIVSIPFEQGDVFRQGNC